MRKIIYLKEEVEVSIGDIIKFNDKMNVEVTEKLIELNPDLFKVVTKTYTTDDGIEIINPRNTKVYVVDIHDLELRGPNTYTGEDKKYLKYFYFRNNALAYIKECKEEKERQELLAEAKRRYPIGTRFKSINGLSNIYIIEGDYLQWSPYYPHYITCGPKGVIIYTQKEDKWAEIITPRFTSEDGVKIYDGMKTYLVHPNDNDDISSWHFLWHGDSKGKNNKYFYHKENALAYIEKHKEKTLEDYENILFKRGNSVISSSGDMYFSVYGWLKDNEPKLYYTKILQLIADDLNDGWVADFSGVNNPVKFYLISSGWNTSFNIDIPGVVYFKSEKLVQKAREILGDKINYLFI